MNLVRRTDSPTPFPYAAPNPARQDVVVPMWEWITEFDLTRDDDAAVRLRSTVPS